MIFDSIEQYEDFVRAWTTNILKWCHAALENRDRALETYYARHLWEQIREMEHQFLDLDVIIFSPATQELLNIHPDFFDMETQGEEKKGDDEINSI